MPAEGVAHADRSERRTFRERKSGCAPSRLTTLNQSPANPRRKASGCRRPAQVARGKQTRRRPQPLRPTTPIAGWGTGKAPATTPSPAASFTTADTAEARNPSVWLPAAAASESGEAQDAGHTTPEPLESAAATDLTTEVVGCDATRPRGPRPAASRSSCTGAGARRTRASACRTSETSAA